MSSLNTQSQPGLLPIVKSMIARDMVLSARIGGSGFLAAVFFIIVVSLVPLGVGPQPEVLSVIASGMIWVGVLLASLLSLDRLFQADFEDGSMELFFLLPLPLPVLVLAKVVAFWLTTALPLIAVAPILGLLLNLPGPSFGALILALVIGTPGLSLIGSIAAALTMGLRRGGLLLSLLSLPLCVPILIFGVGSIAEGSMWNSSMALLLATTLIAIVVAPIAAAGALKLNMT